MKELSEENIKMLTAPVEQDVSLRDHVAFLCHDLKCVIKKVEGAQDFEGRNASIVFMKSALWSLEGAKGGLTR